jgi:endoglucanase
MRDSSAPLAPLGRGINFGNALDAPAGEGVRRFPLLERHFDEVRAAGFDTIRLPVNWAAHARPNPPYSIDPGFFGRVDRAVDEVLRRGLNAVINIHHYHELNEAPGEHAARFVALWRQIAPHFADRGERLYFELLNEPRAAMTAERWNALAPRALAAVRESNPERTVIVGSARMNDIEALPELRLPDDGRLMATVHYYAPMEFTHQGAPWVEGSARWQGTSWGAAGEYNAVRRDLDKAAAWAERHAVPLFLGEFGTYEKADPAARVRWTGSVRQESERLGVGWAYWDFATDFGAYDLGAGTWREPLRKALLGH